MFKKSKRNTISKIIEDNLDYLVRFAYFRLGNRVEAEDLVYDAILKFLEKSTGNIKPESVRLYLFRIVHNLCLDKMRTEKRELSLSGNLDVEYSPEDVLDLEEADRINVCLDSLPQRESEIIRMNVVDNLSFVEISNILSIPQSTAKSRYKSGMEKLRKLFINNKMS
ncbi:MAG: RNA polymerase sigma factor [Muribaculaceae bacterium]|nr:RNA polymerase sigma factor [Muribaculaceae bacterium]MDE6842062.1 RNA polymerase sigma factor [Muribaculaceae bacterium]